MGELIQFARPDGQKCPGYLAEPSAGAAAPAVIVVQEWWGLNPQIKRTADRLANEGFRALVPDLFRGKLASDADEASHLMNTLNFGDAAGQDIRGAAQYLRQKSSKVGIIGFCMGGALVIIAGANVPGIDAGVCFYGIPPKAVADPANIEIPMQYHYANTDDWCTPDRVNEIDESLKNVKAPSVLYRYDAEHAFMNEARPEVYAPEAAKLAWERSITFLRTHLT
ncbi:MAG TPA: dienelactone hydrolase family protein [Polyangiaceae bacterium]|nr:dienelactone hydrolase family protein [Polyangiaceae bacterium]